MAGNSGSNKSLIWFSVISLVVAAGVGGYFIYDYQKTKKANQTVITIDQARAIARANGIIK